MINKQKFCWLESLSIIHAFKVSFNGRKILGQYASQIERMKKKLLLVSSFIVRKRTECFIGKIIFKFMGIASAFMKIFTALSLNWTEVVDLFTCDRIFFIQFPLVYLHLNSLHRQTTADQKDFFWKITKCCSKITRISVLDVCLQ